MGVRLINVNLTMPAEGGETERLTGNGKGPFLDHPRANLRRRDLARVAGTRHPVADGRHHGVRGIAQRSRHPEQDPRDPPGEREPASDAQRRGGAQVDLLVFDQHDAAGRLAADAVLLQQRRRLWRLRRPEPEIAGRVTPGDEPDRSLAKGTRAVEQHDAAGGDLSHTIILSDMK